jgi:hypothetical protein
MDTEEIMRRFEERQKTAKPREKRVDPPPPPPRRYAPTDEKSVKMLSGAVLLTQEIMRDMDPESAEFAALYVLTKFTKEMLGVRSAPTGAG